VSEQFVHSVADDKPIAQSLVSILHHTDLAHALEDNPGSLELRQCCQPDEHSHLMLGEGPSHRQALSNLVEAC
jgi:hypothetical protein